MLLLLFTLVVLAVPNQTRPRLPREGRTKNVWLRLLHLRLSREKLLGFIPDARENLLLLDFLALKLLFFYDGVVSSNSHLALLAFVVVTINVLDNHLDVVVESP